MWVSWSSVTAASRIPVSECAGFPHHSHGPAKGWGSCQARQYQPGSSFIHHALAVRVGSGARRQDVGIGLMRKPGELGTVAPIPEAASASGQFRQPVRALASLADGRR